MTPYQYGRYTAFCKLGLADNAGGEVGSGGLPSTPPSTLEVPVPIEANDEQTPAGQLAAAFSQMPDGMTRSEALKGKGENVEGHLNRNTVWNEPHPITSDMATGASPVMPGRF